MFSMMKQRSDQQHEMKSSQMFFDLMDFLSFKKSHGSNWVQGPVKNYMITWLSCIDALIELIFAQASRKSQSTINSLCF